ncbi:MAG TPA: RNHCP domain-containing protein [Candidatus Moranbacteria bacterium]|nr:RNHCP domain-containing protein [Candidatus Moranbacteria bacterium]
MNKKFQKKKEDFICEKCGYLVKGNGYTNHCPKCLWSKHVDVNPGDRLEKCQGMMSPISIDLKKGKYIILYKCVKCGFERKNKVVDNDNFDIVIKISKNSIKKNYT